LGRMGKSWVKSGARRHGRASWPTVDYLEPRWLFNTYSVVTTADGGAGSLRLAIQNANANPGPDLINFNIPGSGVKIISPTSALSTIIGATTIDGTTQPGYAGTPLIRIDGASAG